MATVDPRNRSTYIFDTEQAYYADYQASFFAVTMEKAGWDCMRHYEILANGCIPLFLNLENCPVNTMTHFPKAIVLETNKLYDDFITLPDASVQDIITFKIRCMHYIEKLLAYTRLHLTDTHMATYVLDKAKLNAANQISTLEPRSPSILYLSGETSADYLRDLVLTGFKNLMGNACHDSPRIDHIYTDFASPEKCYGRGFSYSKIVDPTLRNNQIDHEDRIAEKVRARKYDIVVYGSYHRGMPMWNLVKEHYSDDHIILLCGEDRHRCDCNLYSDTHPVFVREQYTPPEII